MIPENKKIGPLYMEAHLGNPQASCAGFGICSLDVLEINEWIQYRPYRFRSVKARLEFVPGAGIDIFFPKDGMLIPAKTHFFRSGVFQVDAPCPLPESICNITGLEPCQIVAGNYAFEEKEDGYRIFFETSIGSTMLCLNSCA